MIIGDLGLVKKIVTTIDIITITSKITLAELTPHILFFIELITSKDLVVKLLDLEIEVSIIESIIKITTIVTVCITQIQTTTIKRNRRISTFDSKRISILQDNYRTHTKSVPRIKIFHFPITKQDL